METTKQSSGILNTIQPLQLLSPCNNRSPVNKITYSFRELTGYSELLLAFRFRYEEYSGCRMSIFLKENPNRLDIDVYDLHSLHYGLFDQTEKLVGYFRVVLEKEALFQAKVLAIGLQTGIFVSEQPVIHSNETATAADYPFLSYPNVPKSIKDKYHEMRISGQHFAEASRLIITGGHQGIRTSSFLIDCTLVLLRKICSGKSNAIISCHKDHSLFYKKLGFIDFCENMVYHHGHLSTLILVMPYNFSPTRLSPKFTTYITEYSLTNKITFL